MVRLARGSLTWLLAAPLAAFILAALGNYTGWEAFYWLAVVALLVFLFFISFFRDPQRSVANGVASPADGKVRAVDHVVDPDLGACSRLSIFMSPKDVHVNRSPLPGRVVSVLHYAGGHLPAFKKESERNERVEAILETHVGRIKVILIAGTVARRIVPYIREGDELRKGQRIALIRFGSRCDFLVPGGRVRWLSQVGDKVKAASTQVGIEEGLP